MARDGGDLTKYIENNDTPIDSGNYNEVDGLVFAELSYSKFENVTWTEDELKNGVTVSEYATKMLESGQVKAGTDQEKFFQALQSSDRYADATITNMEALNGNDYWSANETTKMSEDGQWAGMTIDIGDDTSVVAFRGTDGTELGWQEDLELAYDPDGTTAQEAARDYLKNTDADHIYLTGHSKGGNDAESAYAMSDKDVRDRVDRVDNYDGPGNNDEFKENYAEGYSELDDKQTNYMTENAAIGKLLDEHPGETKIGQADPSGHDFENAGPLGEHDPFSWKTGEDGESFLPGTQSEGSVDFDTILDETLEGMSPEEREDAVNALLKMGVADDIANMDSKELKDILKKAMEGYGNLTDEEKDALKRLIGLLILNAAVYYYDKKKAERNKKRNRNKKENGSADGGHTRFWVDPDVLKKCICQLEQAAKELNTNIRELEQVKDNLDGVIYILIRLVLDKIWLDLISERRRTKALATTLDAILDYYIDTEERIVSEIKAA
ncbi:MAG: DUF2974 domain-containing protein [Butyrivibrio sp.]|nr:DUF2974 domain-containing protein [Butyrivibrio sp.]